jgi:ubiquinone/menaquinone biosynthesis C-methylase UbiE
MLSKLIRGLAGIGPSLVGLFVSLLRAPGVNCLARVPIGKAKKWEDNLASTQDLLIACVGRQNFGPRPAERIDEIRKHLGGYGRQVAEALSLTQNDVVLDMGSGCGFMARAIAPQVKQIHCADINADFLAFCKHELADIRNVAYHQIEYSEFSSLHGLGINKVYSTSVWIHFNFYDMVLNLRALNVLLPLGGMLYFDFLDACSIKSGDRRGFSAALQSYAANRERIALLMQYNSTNIVETAAELTGFSVRRILPVAQECYSAVFAKISHPSLCLSDGP